MSRQTLILVVAVLMLGTARGADPEWKADTVAKHTVGTHDVVSSDGKYRALFVDDPNNPPMFTTVSKALVVGTAEKMLVTVNGFKGQILTFTTRPDIHVPESNLQGDSPKAVLAAGAFLPNGDHQAHVLIVDLNLRKVVQRINVVGARDVGLGQSEDTRGLAFSPDGKSVFVLHTSGELTAWDVASGKKQRSLLPTKAADSGAPFNLLRRGDFLVAARGRELRVARVDMKKWEVEMKLPAEVDALRASADEATLAVRTRTELPNAGPFSAYKYSLTLHKLATLEQTHALDIAGNGALSFVHLSLALGGKLKTCWMDADPRGYETKPPASAAMMWTPPAKE